MSRTLSSTYDNAGNLTSDGTNSFTWGWRGRMASATVGGTTAAYAYDGMDVRTSETVGGVTTSYLWDRAKGLPLLVDDGANGYLHASGLIAEITGGGAPTYHLTDALGSVRGLTDLAGTVTGTGNFDVFGDVRTQTGATSIFDFAGEQRDVTTGMMYLRARYYEPGYGRFASEDTVVPGGPGTQGFNRFAYAGKNPCTATDPSGNFHGGGIGDCARLAAELIGGIAATLATIRLIVKGVTFGFPAAVVVGVLLIIALIATAVFVITVLECVALILALAISSALSSGAEGPGGSPGEPGDGSRPPTPYPPIPPLPLPSPIPTAPDIP